MKLRLRMTRALLVPAVVLAVFSHHTYVEDSLPDALLGAAGLLLLLASAGGRIWASVYLTGRKNRMLVTEGPFSVVRNPLYFFSFVGFVGAGLAFESVVLAGVFALTFFLSHWPTIGVEERRLEELFGPAYRTYCSRVPRFVPALRRPGAAGTVELDTGMFARAIRDCLAIPLVFAAAELLEWAKLSDLIPVLIRLP